MPRLSGTVKLFHHAPRTADGKGSGYGFILPDDGSSEVFFHRMDLGPSCIEVIDEVAVRLVKAGERVTYEPVPGTPGKGNGLKAARVELIDED